MLIRDLGLRDYVEVWDLQRRLVYERQEGAIPDTILLCQHHPVYTIGRSSRQPVPPGLPFPVHAVERGGDMTWHGPGQLVGYPILDLAALGLGARSYLRALEAVLAQALLPLGVEASAAPGFTGLWVGRRKLASIGVAVSGGVSYHGFALNVNNDLAAFRLIHPCRLESDVMITLRELLGAPVDEAALAETVGRTLIEYLGRHETVTPIWSNPEVPA
ncbi:MAG: lipoyl(octanoyl) transferase LipB [Elusimicrobia bacterium]|nr:lipoyl(octanoyl) transferase LipB [Elusimicrobiota bacterium]